MKSKIIYLGANFTARFVTTLMTFVLLGLYGLESVGRFSYLLSLVAILVPLSEFGMSQTFLIQSVKNNYSSYSLVYSKVLLSCSIALVLVLGGMWLIDKSIMLLVLLAIVLSYIFVNSICGFYISESDYIKSAVFRIFFVVITFSTILLSWIMDISFDGFLYIYSLSGLIYVLIFSSRVLHRGYIELNNAIKSIYIALLKNSQKFFLSSVILSLSASLPLIIMESIASPEQLGEFATSMRVVLVFFTVFSIISQISFFELLKSDGSEKQLLYQITFFLVIGLGGFIIISIIPSDLFARLFSISVSSSNNIDQMLQVLKYLLFLQALNLPLGQFLSSKNLIGLRLTAQFSSIVIAAIYLFLIFDQSISPSMKVIQAVILNEVLVLVFLLLFIFVENKKSLGGSL